MKKSFNVIWQDFNRKAFEPYDVMPYFVREYQDSEEKPQTFEEFKSFIMRKSQYMFWSRCEHEIILCGWPNVDTHEKWDIHQQVMMNIDTVTEILMENVKS